MQTGEAQLGIHQGLLGRLQAQLLVAQHFGLQLNGVLQTLHKLVVVVHHLGFELGPLVGTPALLHFCLVGLQLLHLLLGGSQRLLALAQQLAGFVTLARSQLNGHHQGIQCRHNHPFPWFSLC